MDTQAVPQPGSTRTDVPAAPASIAFALLPFALLLALGLAFPLFGGGYWGTIATRACVYWVLVSGLNLVVGFAGQIAIGWVALLTLGAYTTSVLAAGNVMPVWPPYLALTASAVVGAEKSPISSIPNGSSGRTSNRAGHSIAGIPFLSTLSNGLIGLRPPPLGKSVCRPCP